MASSQDSVASLIPAPEISEPATPKLSQTSLDASDVSKIQSNRVENATGGLTPPPSTQVPNSQRSKERTPTPTFSQISTPPPTVGPSKSKKSKHNRIGSVSTEILSEDQIATKSADELRSTVNELQAALKEAKTQSAHHKLQYEMLSQESAASIERMAVEARMAQYENEVIHNAEQAKTSSQGPALQEGMIPVQKDHYTRLCTEIHRLTESNHYLQTEYMRHQKTITMQESEIASLDDKVILLRERIRENRDHMHRYRQIQPHHQNLESTPRSLFTTPQRAMNHDQQPFAALLQASEMASQEARRPSASKKAQHMRNTHSLSSIPQTPPQARKYTHMYHTPQARQSTSEMHHQIPSSAPLPRTSAMRTPPGGYNAIPHTAGPGSDGTVSASDREDDSEAETIIEPDSVNVSQASLQASQMLRSSQEQQAQRSSFMGSGMKSAAQPKQQTKLFGAVTKKRGAERDEEPVAKRQAIGLGIAGVRGI